MKKKSKTSSPAPDSISLEPTVSSIRCENALELGKKLVDELGLEDSNDTLGRWMAHHIANKLKSLELCPENERSKRRSDCCTEILKLWAHRRELDGPRRMLETFDSIFAVLESLERGSFVSRYVQRPRDVKGESEATGKWLDRITKIDDAARALIYYCLGKSAETAADENADWVRIAQEVSSPSDMEIQLIARVSNWGSSMDAGNSDDLKRQKSIDLIAKMEQLSELAKDVVADIQLQLK
jgi:hypothetical protein